jgi:hypothetical protein
MKERHYGYVYVLHYLGRLGVLMMRIWLVYSLSDGV